MGAADFNTILCPLAWRGGGEEHDEKTQSQISGSAQSITLDIFLQRRHYNCLSHSRPYLSWLNIVKQVCYLQTLPNLDMAPFEKP